MGMLRIWTVSMKAKILSGTCGCVTLRLFRIEFIVEIEARTRGGAYLEPFHQRLSTVVTGSNSYAFGVEDLGNVNSVLPWNIGQDGMGTYSHNRDNVTLPGYES